MSKSLAKQPDLSAILADSARDVELKRYAEMSEDELAAVEGLSDHERRKVRMWQRPKSEVPFWLEASHAHVAASLGKEAEKTGMTLNVQNMTVVLLPEKRDEEEKPVYIDVNTEQDDD